MVSLVPFNFNDYGKWVKETINCVFCEDTNGIVALRDGRPVGAVICDNWTDSSVNAHIAVLDPVVLRHRLLEEAAQWVFITAKRDMIIGNVPASNKKALKLNKHIGYTELCRIPNAYKHGEDIVLMTLHKKDCKFLPEEIRKAA